MAKRTKKLLACAAAAMALLCGAIVMTLSKSASSLSDIGKHPITNNIPRSIVPLGPDSSHLNILSNLSRSLDSPLPDHERLEARAEIQARDWSGSKWQDCYIGPDCQPTDQLTCQPGEYWIGWERYYCPFTRDGPGQGRPICCPIDTVPPTCTWRGGEDGSLECNGQCYDGEITLFNSYWGGGNSTTEFDTSLCDKGVKSFCCESQHWKDVIGTCSLTDCGALCSDSMESIATVTDWDACPNGSPQQYCCPEGNVLSNIQWAGTDECDFNYCVDSQLYIMRNRFGSSGNSEGCPSGKERMLCCDAPQNQTFAPFDPGFLFPEAPPPEDEVKWDFQPLKSNDPAPNQDITNASAFGIFIIEGPPSAVLSSVVKRDGSASDLHFLSCEKKTSGAHYVARLVCLADGTDHDCHDMLEGGIEGTILEMPQGCGSDKYAVAHYLEIAANQTLPSELLHIRNQTVMELAFDYNFGRVKRDTGDVFFRADYSNIAGYWKHIIEPESGTQLNARDFVDESTWKEWLESLVDSPEVQSQNGTELFFGLGGVTKPLLSQVVPCAEQPPNYSKIKVSGWASVSTMIAMMIQGRIAPDPYVTQAISYTRDRFSSDVAINHWNNGHLNVSRQVEPFLLQQFDNFSHAGLFTIDRRFEIDVALEGDVDFNGNYSTSFHSGTASDIQQGFPATVADQGGQTTQYSEHFEGQIAESRLTGSVKISVIPRVVTNVSIHEPTSDPNGMLTSRGTGDLLISSEFEGFLESYSFFETSDGGAFKAYAGTEPARGFVKPLQSMNKGSIIQWNTKGDEARDWGTTTFKEIGSGQSGAVPEPSAVTEPIVGDAEAVFDRIPEYSLTCTEVEIELKCKVWGHNCDLNICGTDEYKQPCIDDDDMVQEDWEPDDIEYSDDIDAVVDQPQDFNVLASRPYDVRFTDGRTLSIRSQDAPTARNLYLGQYGAGFPPQDYQYVGGDCKDVGVGGVSIQDLARFDFSGRATEHILELQTVRMFLTTLESGILPSGGRLSTGSVPADWLLQYWNTQSLPIGLGPVHDYNNRFSRIPNNRVFEALGSKVSRREFVLLDAEINSVKARVWSRIPPRNLLKFRASVRAWLYDCKDAGDFLKFLKATRAVFSYIEDEEVHNKLWKSVETVRRQLELIENNISYQVILADSWDFFIVDFLIVISDNAKTWMQQCLTTAENEIRIARSSGKELTATEEGIFEVEETLEFFRSEVGNMQIPPFGPIVARMKSRNMTESSGN